MKASPMQITFAAAMIFAISGTLDLAHAQEGDGRQYDTRDPFVCASTKAPAKGAPSPAQVVDYVRCNAISGEKIAGGRRQDGGHQSGSPAGQPWLIPIA